MKGEDLHHQISLFLEEAYNGCEKSLRLQTPQPGSDGQVRREERTLKVKIPAGVRDGQHTFACADRAALASATGRPGTSIWMCASPPSPLPSGWWRPVRHGSNHPWEAALGASIQVPTMGGKATLKVPEGSRKARSCALRGQGHARQETRRPVCGAAGRHAIETDGAQQRTLP